MLCVHLFYNLSLVSKNSLFASYTYAIYFTEIFNWFNIYFKMSAEKYLNKFEANCLLPEVIKIPPPEISNFYWKNDYGNKYKAFIPTPNRIVYYNLEEYGEFMSKEEINDFGWTFAQKCVLLAVSDTYTEDQPFIQQMEFLIANLTAWGNNTAENRRENVELCDQQYEHKNRHYVLTKYFVDDIKNVRMEARGFMATFKGTLTITSEHDGNARIIDAMNTAFELAAKRFADDSNLKVYSYQSR
ncbi:unnamed protein product [Aphis gossypii]|uniref:Uncharacterized protein n=1 Tax=Aphis gossypii TaxID=80765 RepID=A0A9P0JCA0_APHGO|nr:unnamed protein product [Aphis gossypii]